MHSLPRRSQIIFFWVSSRLDPHTVTLTPMADATTSYSSISTSATTVPVEGMLSHNREDQSRLATPRRRPSVRYVRTTSLQRLSYQSILSSLFRKPRPQSSSAILVRNPILVHNLLHDPCRPPSCSVFFLSPTMKKIRVPRRRLHT